MFAAIAAAIVQQDADQDFLTKHVNDYEELFEALKSINIDAFANICRISRKQIQETNCRLQKSCRFRGPRHTDEPALYIGFLSATTYVGFDRKLRSSRHPLPPLGLWRDRRWSENGDIASHKIAPIIAGLIPCNSVAEEILTDHPDRFRAMIIESANPVHSAESQKFRDAIAAAVTVVIDVAMTETAMFADYVLPTANQYEKAEAAFFNFEFPDNYFQLREPTLRPPSSVLTEAEIHCRLAEAMGAVPQDVVDELNALNQSRSAFQTKRSLN